MKENTIVSLADSNYFELLNELIDSIQKFENSRNPKFEYSQILFSQTDYNFFLYNKIMININVFFILFFYY